MLNIRLTCFYTSHLRGDAGGISNFSNPAASSHANARSNLSASSMASHSACIENLGFSNSHSDCPKYSPGEGIEGGQKDLSCGLEKISSPDPELRLSRIASDLLGSCPCDFPFLNSLALSRTSFRSSILAQSLPPSPEDS